MTRLLSPSILPAAVLACLGCATLPHAELTTAPDSDAPYEERAEYFQEHAPDLVNFGETGYLLLHGGKRLYFPEDLRPAVAAESPTARAIDEHVPNREAARSIFNWVSLPSMAVATLGGIGASVALPLALNASDGDAGQMLTDPMLMGSSGAFLVGLVGMGVGGLLASEPSRVANESLITILSTYPQSLEDQVDIHVDGDGNLVDTATTPSLQPGNRAVGAQQARLQI